MRRAAVWMALFCTLTIPGAWAQHGKGHSENAGERGELPVNANYRVPDPDCDLNLVLGGPRRQRVRMTLSNSFGFGGSNSCIALRHPELVEASG